MFIRVAVHSSFKFSILFASFFFSFSFFFPSPCVYYTSLEKKGDRENGV